MELLRELLLKPKKKKAKKRKILKEVLDKPSPDIKKAKTAITGILPNRKSDVIGSGLQSIAYLHEKFPGKIIKTIQITGPDDPTYQFMRMALRHQDNPYFPKIYSIKKYDTKKLSIWAKMFKPKALDIGKFYTPEQKKYTLIVVLEQLRSITIEYADLRRMGIRDDLSPKERKRLNPKLIPAFLLRMAFYSPQQRAITRQSVIDPQLKEALRLLEPLFRHFQPDMHEENIMARGDGHWVFMDPIAP